MNEWTPHRVVKFNSSHPIEACCAQRLCQQNLTNNLYNWEETSWSGGIFFAPGRRHTYLTDQPTMGTMLTAAATQFSCLKTRTAAGIFASLSAIHPEFPLRHANTRVGCQAVHRVADQRFIVLSPKSGSLKSLPTWQFYLFEQP